MLSSNVRQFLFYNFRCNTAIHFPDHCRFTQWSGFQNVEFKYVAVSLSDFRCPLPSALGTWVFSVAGALLAIPVGIKKKSLAPLVFFGTTGTMLDIIMGISQCEREHAERQMKLLESQNAEAAGALTEPGAES
ncbi:hypothetical protein Acr_04g0000710 [Actinidia rufa]|uniref:Transmembrane protein n=1 Tax=Actinidia rufa TaxID=165716 RepID=A0A7J0EFU8_9ERIC|nr:hypothetical protein Acr_04g0000710 [Actinidia rufa]